MEDGSDESAQQQQQQPPQHRRETLYLIDGYAAIFRAYHAIRHPLYSPVTGEQTQAVLVFAQMLLKLYNKLRPDYVALALDAPGRTFRDDLYAGYEQLRQEKPASEPSPAVLPDSCEAFTPAAPPTSPTAAGYKGTRAAAPDPLSQQMPRIRELLDLLGIPVVCKPGLEADDVIATITDRVLSDAAHPGLRVRIVSPDKDLEQLLTGDRVTLFDVHTEVETDEAALLQKRGVTPAQVVDLLALTGDAVDNVPGVDGIGPRTAAKLVQQFGSLDGVLENLDQVKGWWKENLEKARPVLPLSRRLLTLERDPEIAFSLEEARARPLPAADLTRLFDELGFSRLKALLPPPAQSEDGDDSSDVSPMETAEAGTREAEKP